eukprot:gene1260-1389_t
MEEMKCFVYEENPDVVLITESWTNENINNAELSLEGYSLEWNDRKNQRGGCMIYLKEGVTGLNEKLTFTESTETVWCNLIASHTEIIIGVCYQKPSANAEEEEALHNLIKQACENNTEVLICGDFNHRTINWDLLQAQAEGRKLLDLTQDCFLTQHVKEPTRGENILDLVLSNKEEMVENVVVREPFSTSDHNVVAFDLVTEMDLAIWKEEYYSYRNGDYKGMKKYFDKIDWSNEIDIDNGEPEAIWNNFKKKDKHCY